MSAKRPRPAVPVLVHVDNPAEVGSVTVDTSTIEGKMDTVITNQNRIYDKIPTSSGGGSSADLTTVNEKTTALAEAIGPVSSTSSDDNIFGSVRNLRAAVGDATATPSIDGTDLRSLLYNVREAIGYSSTSPTTTGTSIRNKLATIDENTTTIKNVVGTNTTTTAETSLLGAVRNLVGAVGSYGGAVYPGGTTVRSYLANLSLAVGSSSVTPTATENTVRGLLTAIKENTASGGGGGGSADLTTVNEKTTALAAAIGSASDDSSTVSVIGLLKSITDKY